MARYYCHKCSRSQGLVAPVDPEPIVANDYQLHKFIKHTAPTGVYPTNSVFSGANWDQYKDYCVATASSGCLEIDDRGRRNLIYFAGREVGLKYDGGVFTSACSGVKLVCSEASGAIHGFPAAFHPESVPCANCGALVPFR